MNPHIEKVNSLFNDITRQIHANNSSVLIIYFNKNSPCLPERRGEEVRGQQEVSLMTTVKLNIHFFKGILRVHLMNNCSADLVSDIF